LLSRLNASAPRYPAVDLFFLDGDHSFQELLSDLRRQSIDPADDGLTARRGDRSELKPSLAEARLRPSNFVETDFACQSIRRSREARYL
jgi:hypothetical protein